MPYGAQSKGDGWSIAAQLSYPSEEARAATDDRALLVRLHTVWGWRNSSRGCALIERHNSKLWLYVS